MDEAEIQRRRRDNDEEATERRAKVLGLPYIDARDFENTIQLIDRPSISVEQMHKDFIIPLQKGGGELHFQFMVTSQCPRSTMEHLTQRFAAEGERADFFLISNSAYKVFMNRYDPPKEEVFDDITIATEGDSDTIASVSQTLDQVSTEKVFDYLISQADRLKASDIHIENTRQ